MPPSPRSGRSVPILIVEDNEADRRLLSEAVRDGPVAYEVHCVRDGREAIGFLRQDAGSDRSPRPAFVLLDLNMPRMGGREVLVALQKDPRTHDIPVIVMTSAPIESESWIRERSGAADFFRKPPTYPELRSALRRCDRFAGAGERAPAEAAPG